MIVIGTAGHIDHGKSAVVKRLTGTDPDRLPEEKARGMTIDLGFAFYKTANQDTIALVDVPGHERFVKNMISGCGGIDAVMLVIAADDGWMPQSEEHFQITRLLGIKYGMIIINKSDLVEDDWLEILKEDIQSRIKGSFLESAEIFTVSAQTGNGFDELKNYLNILSEKVKAREDIGKARLSIDRTFLRQGIGTVVTGTLRGGSFSVGQTVGLFPSLTTGKIRTLQSNGIDVTIAQPGQRTAISITGTGKDELVRGGVLNQKKELGYFINNPVLALSIELLQNAPVSLSDRRECLLITGTTEIAGEIRLLGDRKDIKPSENGILFFKPEKPINSLVMDHYILRLPTPMITLGGGQIIDHLPHFPRRKQMAQMDYLKSRMIVSLESLILSELEKSYFANENTFLEYASLSSEVIKQELIKLIDTGEIGRINNFIYDLQLIKKLSASAIDILKKYFKKNTHHNGVDINRLLQLMPLDESSIVGFLEYMINEKSFVKNGELYDLAGRGVSLKGVIKQAYDDINERLQKDPFMPPTLSDLASGGKIYQNAIKFILEAGECYKCGTDYIFLINSWQEMITFIKEQLNIHDKLTVADLRNKFSISRKYAIPILEETDRLGLTKRAGDIRVKGDKYEG